MKQRNFNLRLTCTYDSAENNPASLVVDARTGHKWETFNPCLETPGFLLFVYALFSCQLRYMRVNCAERNIILQSSSGEIRLAAGEYWDIKKVFVSFTSVLKSGIPDADDIDYIRERMKHCPVSTNLPDSVELHNEISFV